MDRYQRVEKPRPESTINENEIRITTQGLIRNYISYANSLLLEKRVREIVLKAMGQAISKTVAIVEIIKKRIPGLHQETTISSRSITDVWEPIEEGLVPLEMIRHVSMISISLSMRELNKNSPGYQAPSHLEQPKQQYQQQQHLQPKQAPAPISGANEDSYGRGRGRGRGRGKGWWGRGGYGNTQENGGYWGRGGYGNTQENGGYWVEVADEAEVGSIVVLDTKEAEADSGVIVVAGDIWVAVGGVEATSPRCWVGMFGFALVKCLPWRNRESISSIKTGLFSKELLKQCFHFLYDMDVGWLALWFVGFLYPRAVDHSFSVIHYSPPPDPPL